MLLVALGLLLGTIVARINQSSADTLTLRSSVLQASGDQLGLWHDEAKTDPDVFLRDTDGGGACGGGQCLVGAAPIADGKFHHIAMVRDIQANNLLLYVDGNLDIGVPLNAGAQGEIRDDDGESDPFLIGASALARFPPVTTKANFFSGTIDEVEIFNRALSAGEIRAIYDAGSAGKIKP